MKSSGFIEMLHLVDSCMVQHSKALGLTSPGVFFLCSVISVYILDLHRLQNQWIGVLVLFGYSH